MASNSFIEVEAAPAAPLLINSKDASEILGISSRKLWSLTNCNAIPSRKIDSMVRYSLAELAAWCECGCPTNAGAGDQVRKAVRK